LELKKEESLILQNQLESLQQLLEDEKREKEKLT